jgi:hypothetical protein
MPVTCFIIITLSKINIVRNNKMAQGNRM